MVFAPVLEVQMLFVPGCDEGAQAPAAVRLGEEGLRRLCSESE
jgi:hypothetical protein